MKKSLTTASLAVFGLFLAYSILGTGVRIARADRGEGGGGDGGGEDSVQIQAAATGSGVRAEANSNDQGENEEYRQHQDEQQGKEVDLEMEQGDQDVVSSSTLEESIKHREDELDSEAASSTLDSDQREALKNQNEVRLTVHALLSAKSLLGGIGPEVSQIARDLDSSVTSTVSAEAKINARNWFTRLFFGGDRQSAADIQREVDSNKADIQKLNDLIASCQNCSPSVKTILQDRLNIALAEQNRLAAMAKAETDSQGLVNLILGLFGGK